MKKILSITFLALLMLCGKAYSQSNLTWVVKDKIGDNTFRSQTAFNTSIEGLANPNEAKAFFDKIKSNENIESCENKLEQNGSYFLALKVKKASPSSYYLALAKDLGITTIVVNGEKKSTDELIKEQKR